MARVSKSAYAVAPAVDALAQRRRKGEDDRELVRLCQNGTSEAFEELIRRHQQRVFAVIRGILRRSEDVEDVAQQVFIKAYFSIRKFDMRAAFSTWLYKITVNECWDYLRKKRVRPLSYESDLSEEQAEKLHSYVAAEKAPSDPGERAEFKELVEHLMSQLEEKDRQMLRLKEVEGLSVEELSELFDMNVNTVKVRLFRARGRLLETFERRLNAAASRPRGMRGGK